jgi:hypothetical protein
VISTQWSHNHTHPLQCGREGELPHNSNFNSLRLLKVETTKVWVTAMAFWSDFHTFSESETK